MRVGRILSRWAYPLILLIITTGIIYQSHSLFQVINAEVQQESHQFPYESFAFIAVDLNINFSEASGVSLPEGPAQISSRGSGMVVGTTANGHAAVLTANHVCNPPPFTLPGWSNYLEKDIRITDFFGNIYDATIILNNVQDDLCLLEVAGFDTPGVKLSTDDLILGEKVYSVAAPMAFFSPGMVPMLDGYYSGDIYSSNGLDSVFTIPAREGSSGSSVINSRGELVGVVHSALTGFQNVTICSTHNQLRAFLLEFEYILDGTLSQ
jgi:S1-C subfamily serine protease